MIRIHSIVTSSITLASLQKLRAGDIPGATRLLEPFCFGSAENFFNTQPPHNDSETEMLAQEMLHYRATYRTNSADWDGFERKLEVELGNEKQIHSAGWDVVWSGTNGAWSGMSK